MDEASADKEKVTRHPWIRSAAAQWKVIRRNVSTSPIVDAEIVLFRRSVWGRGEWGRYGYYLYDVLGNALYSGVVRQHTIKRGDMSNEQIGT